MVDRKKPRSLARCLSILRRQMPDLSARYHVRSLGAFGSYVRHEANARSDLDLLVEFDEPPGLIAFIALENELSAMLGVKVDLVMKTALKLRIGERILREVVPV